MQPPGRSDSLPTYNDIIREERIREAGLFYGECTKNTFKIIDFLVLAVAGMALLIMSFAKPIELNFKNMSQACNDPVYNISPKPKTSNLYTNLSIMVMVLICGFKVIIKDKIEGTGKKWWYLLSDLGKPAAQLIFLNVSVLLLKYASAIPRPYFFSHEGLRDFYCTGHSNRSLNATLAIVDTEYKMSFPSLQASNCAFCLVYVYLYLDHIDIANVIRSAQASVLIIGGTQLFWSSSKMVEVGESHLSDILAGLVLGTVHAVIGIRNLFGSVFPATKLNLPVNTTRPSISTAFLPAVPTPSTPTPPPPPRPHHRDCRGHPQPCIYPRSREQFERSFGFYELDGLERQREREVVLHPPVPERPRQPYVEYVNDFYEMYPFRHNEGRNYDDNDD